MKHVLIIIIITIFQSSCRNNETQEVLEKNSNPPVILDRHAAKSDSASILSVDLWNVRETGDSVVFMQKADTTKHIIFWNSMAQVEGVVYDVFEDIPDTLIRTLSFAPGYGILLISTIPKGDGFSLEINSDHYRVAYGGKSRGSLKYLSLKEYAFSGYITLTKEQKLSLKPQGNPIKSGGELNDMVFEADSVYQDWIHLRTSQDCQISGLKNSTEGWLRYRDGRKLLIDVGLRC